jgi:inorganic pyrophosphatase
MHDRPLEYRPHPWHGVDPGKRFPEIVRAYIEIVPTDGVKYEIDKHSGYLMVDRPQRFSSFCPTLYGFVPRTYCGDRVAAYALAGSPPVSQGDGDPLDICVLTDRPISRGEILLEARPVGGLRMVERGEADDKILAVLLGDPTYGEIVDVSQLPRPIIDRLRHYLLTYKIRRSPATRRTPSLSTRCMTRRKHVAFSRRRAPITRMPFPTDAFRFPPHLLRPQRGPSDNAVLDRRSAPARCTHAMRG